MKRVELSTRESTLLLKVVAILLAVTLIPACQKRKTPAGLPSDTTDRPSVCVGAGGNPIAAWQDNGSGKQQIYLRSWNGSQWAELAGSGSGGGVSTSVQAARYPVLALEVAGAPVLAWADATPGPSQIYLKRWSGAQWVELGGSASAGGISNLGMGEATHQCALALDGTDRPAVAWIMTTAFIGTFQLYFKRWDGAQWVELGGSASGPGLATDVSGFPALAIDPSGNPVVAWQQSVNGMTPSVQIYLKRWDGAQWVEQGGSATSGGVSGTTGLLAESPSLALDGIGNPTVAWQDGASGTLQIYVKQWSGTQWAELAGSATAGGVSGTTGLARDPSVVLDSGNPLVAWTDNKSGNAEIYLKKWTGVLWVELGGSATTGGVSSTAGTSETSSLALDASGKPVVAWRDDASGKPEVYLKQWNGTQWVELAASASGTGISQ